jgi:hypothetical protein
LSGVLPRIAAGVAMLPLAAGAVVPAESDGVGADPPMPSVVDEGVMTLLWADPVLPSLVGAEQAPSASAKVAAEIGRRLRAVVLSIAQS